MRKIGRKIVRVTLAVVAVAATSGFLFPKKYKQPEVGAPSAVLVVSKSKAEIDQPSPQDEPTRYFSAYENPSCSKEGGGFLGTLTAPRDDALSKLTKPENIASKDFRVAVGRPLYLKSRAHVVIDSRRRAFKARHCINLVSFTPMDGRRYEARQISDNERCLLLVTDLDSGEVPDDLETVPVAGACRD